MKNINNYFEHLFNIDSDKLFNTGDRIGNSYIEKIDDENVIIDSNDYVINIKSEKELKQLILIYRQLHRKPIVFNKSVEMSDVHRMDLNNITFIPRKDFSMIGWKNAQNFTVDMSLTKGCVSMFSDETPKKRNKTTLENVKIINGMPSTIHGRDLICQSRFPNHDTSCKFDFNDVFFELFDNDWDAIFNSLKFDYNETIVNRIKRELNISSSSFKHIETITLRNMASQEKIEFDLIKKIQRFPR